jgi:hypothetical protein
VSLCKTRSCDAAEIKRCMDGAFQFPIAAQVQSMTIADGATFCVSQIESIQ